MEYLLLNRTARMRNGMIGTASHITHLTSANILPAWCRRSNRTRDV